MSTINMREQGYDTTTITLHWLTAVLTLTLWMIGQTADWIPRGPVRIDYWSIHVVLGFVLAILLVWRILWRGFKGRRLPPADLGALQFLAKASHYLLYALLLIVVGLGVVNAVVRGYNLFDLFKVPQIGDTTLGKPITRWHGLAANFLLGLAFLHVMAALMHHYVLRDDVFGRMLSRRPVPKTATRNGKPLH